MNRAASPRHVLGGPADNPDSPSRSIRLAADVNGATHYRESSQQPESEEGINIAGLIYKELWHDPKTCEWTKTYSSDVGWLWVKLISFVDDNQTRGVVTVTQALSVATLNHIPSKAVNDLVKARGLDVVAGGYRIHNFLRRDRLSSIRRGAGSTGGRKTRSNLLKQNEQQVAATVAAVNGEQQNLQQNSGVGVGVVEELFQTWKGAAGKPTARLTPKRHAAIKRALKDYEPDEVRDALLGWQNDPWLDRPQYIDPVQLLRDSEHVEKFRDFQRNGRPVPKLFKADGVVARAQARAQAFEGLAVALDDEAPPQLEEGA